jgi:thiol-disulfide isomerase/thioredoxin
LLVALAFSVTFLWVFHENSKKLADEKFKQFMSRQRKAFEAYESDSSTNALGKLAQDARALQKDYPNEANGYQLMIMAIEDGANVDQTKSRNLAQEIIDGTAPERFKLWANGFLYRMDSQGKPITIKFTAVDGREVDLDKMKGKVVLVDFWATTCGPCVAELPRVKAAFEKYQQKGFEVIGISCDTDKQKLERFLKEHEIAWPQYFDGQQQERNKYAQGFGIDGIPHMFFVDKKGCLRFDNVRASGDQINFEKKIEVLLAEQ